LIGDNGEQLGVLPTFEALQIARERGLDLVEVAPTAVPPVCRLMDYGRFKYEQEKKDREARKNQKITLMKEIRLRPKTDEHDIDFKAKQIERFVEEGDRVKVTLRFRGREIAHPGVGRQLLEDMANRVKEFAAVERMPLMEGNTMTMILTKAKTAPAASRPAQQAETGGAAPPAAGPAPAPRPAAPAVQSPESAAPSPSAPATPPAAQPQSAAASPPAPATDPAAPAGQPQSAAGNPPAARPAAPAVETPTPAAATQPAPATRPAAPPPRPQP
jgi:translation initiation factor IF-3